jgi:hypothetical protein
MKKLLILIFILLFVPSSSTNSQDNNKCPSKEQIDAKLDSIVKQNTIIVKKVSDSIKVKNAKLKKKL